MKISVQYFGDFKILYDDMPLVGNKVHKESQFNRLLLALFYAGSSGMDKAALEKFVVGDFESEEEHSALRIIVYKAKKKLQTLGINHKDPIFQKKGIYYWTPDIPVESDCGKFDELFEQAEAIEMQSSSKMLEKKLFLYMEAAYLYKGEFLEAYAAETSIAMIAKKYRDRFKVCVEQAAYLLEQLKDWDNLEMLGKFATTAQPYCDWEALVMQALVEKRKFEEASDYYSDVVDSYLKDCGIYPSDKLTSIMDGMSENQKENIDTLDDIQNILDELRPDIDGGYYCSFPVFKGIYQMAVRSMERTGVTAYLLLCKLLDNSGNKVENDEISTRLGNAIRVSIRHGDMYTDYGKGQFLVLLTNTSLENCEIVQKRIDKAFAINQNMYAIKYHVNNVTNKF